MSPAGGKLKRNAGSRSLFLAKSAPRLGVRTYPWREAGRPAVCTRRPAHGAHGLLIQPVQNTGTGPWGITRPCSR